MNQSPNPALDPFKSHLGELAIAMYHLGLSACTPRQMVITERRATIVIERPDGASFIQGAMRRRQTTDGVTRTVFTTPFHGCLLEWEVESEAKAG